MTAVTWILVFGGSAFTAFALYLTIAPFLGGRRAATRVEHLDEEIREIEQLVARREVLLSSLRELDFEHETNKIATDDYEQFRTRYEREAVKIMQRLDELHGGRGWQERIDDELEERLGRRPRHSSALEDPPPGDSAEPHEAAVEPSEPGLGDEEVDEEVDEEEVAPPEAGDEEEPPQPQALADLTCIKCGEPLDVTDRFCSQCGTPVDVPETDNAETREANA